MKERLLIACVVIVAVIAAFSFNPTIPPEVEECAACNGWYTCDPPRCSQTVTYWDDWRECMEYSKAMGFPGCACIGQDLK